MNNKNVQLSIKSFEILIIQYIARNIKIKVDEFNEYYWDNLDVEFNSNHNSLHIYFKFYETSLYSKVTDVEDIDFGITKNTEVSKEHLEEIEKKFHVDKNCIYNIINMLKEI